MIKTVRKLGPQTDFLNLIKVNYKTPTANVIMEENLIPPLKVGEGCWPGIQRDVERPIQPGVGDQGA